MSLTLAEAKKLPQVRVASRIPYYGGRVGRVVEVDDIPPQILVSLSCLGRVWFYRNELELVAPEPEPPATTTPLPTIYLIRGPVSGELSEKARKIYAQDPAITYVLGTYFNRPDGRFAYSPDELENAIAYLSRRVHNFIASGLGKSLIIDGVPEAAWPFSPTVALEAGYAIKEL